MAPLLLTLAKGVLTGIGKSGRLSADAPLPAVRLARPAAPVDLRKVTAYARVCGFRETDPVPLTYPHILGFPLAARLMAARDFPLPLLGLVHTSVEITQHRPLHPSDPLGLTVHAEKLRAHRRGVEVVIVTEARAGSELVWEDRSTYLARDTRGAVSGSPASPAPAPPSAERRPLVVRDTWPLGADLGRRHAAVSGDYNPIHLHPWTARPLGFPRAIAHGMWTFARCVAEAAGPTAGPVTVRADFRAPVLLPATVTYAAGCGGDFELRSGPDGERLHLTGKVSHL